MMSEDTPIVLHLKKHRNGFGLHVKGQVQDGGDYRSINGTLYLPMQQISSVNACGAAVDAGVQKGDRILEVNGINVEGLSHSKVVDLIRQCADELTLTVVRELAPANESLCQESLRIQDFTLVEKDGESYVVYNIYSTKFLVSRRYREFHELDVLLKARFPQLRLLRLPIKWPITPSSQMLESRRVQLEAYLQKMFTYTVLRKFPAVRAFLNLPDESHEDKEDTDFHADQSTPSEL